jgi:hypothetical protein
VAELSRAKLNRLVAAGVDGFVCTAGRLHTMGGASHFTGDRGASLNGEPTNSSAAYADRRW